MVLFFTIMVIIQPSVIDFWEVRTLKMHFIGTEEEIVSLSVAFIKQQSVQHLDLMDTQFTACLVAFTQLRLSVQVCPAWPSNGFQVQWQAELKKTVPRQWGWRANKLVKVKTSSTPQPQLAHPELE